MMSVDILTELHCGDIIQINAGLTKVSGYFIRKDEKMIYISSKICAHPENSSNYVSISEQEGYYHNNLEIEVLKRCNQHTQG